MKLLHIIPITKGGTAEFLSYLSTESVAPGSLVEIEIRKKMYLGIVIEEHEPRHMKDTIKSSPFKLKKINKIVSPMMFQPSFINAVRTSADYYASSASMALSELTPKKILDAVEEVSMPELSHVQTGKGHILLEQSSTEDRYSTYKSIVREAIARRESVYVCLPTHADIQHILPVISKGIEEHTFVLTGMLSDKAQLKTWNECMSEKKPILILGTGQFLCIPRHDIQTMIVERASSKAYKMIRKPYIDVSLFAEILAKSLGRRLILGDVLHKTDTLKRYYDNEIDAYSPLKFRSLSPATCKVVTPKKNERSSFSVFSSEMISLIEISQQNNGRLFLYVARKGLYPTIVCNDCGKTVVCTSCTSPMTLYGDSIESKTNVLRCHKCGDERNSGENCRHCNSWKLQVLGIGIDGVRAEIESLYPDRTVFVVNSNATKTPKQVSNVMKKFYSSPGSILLGTDIALPHLIRDVEYAGIVSLDSFFSIPDYRIRERVMQILLTIRAKVRDLFIVQTRYADEMVFEYALKGNLSDFYKDEISQREKFGYPPFASFIKITRAGEQAEVAKELKQLEGFFKPHTLYTFPSFVEKVKGKFVMNGLLRLQPDVWIHGDLLSKLRMLPPSYRVEVDPENLL